MEKPPGRITPSSVAFIIEESINVWTKTPACPTQERAAADALLARYVLMPRTEWPRIPNLAFAARVLHANTHDSSANSVDWEDMALPERLKWADRAEMVIKAGMEA